MSSQFIHKRAFLEAKTVQNPILKYSTEIGWEFLDNDKELSLRDGETGILFEEILKGKLFEFNDWMEEDIADEVIKEFRERTKTDILGNRKILNLLRGKTAFYSRQEKRELDIRLIDFENIERNTFQVVKELSFTNGKAWNRYDLVFYINGIPVLICETKSPEKEEGIGEAWEQIGRYHRETPEFLIFPQIYVISNLLEFKYGPTWNLEERGLYRWKGDSLEKITKSFLDKRRILSFLEDYIIFWEKEGEVKKFILAFHQIRAVEKIVKRVLEGKKKEGLVWHTQGSGKTLTMIVSAHKLRKIPALQNPTLILVVDRNELEEQLERNLESYGFKDIEIAQSKKHLKELLDSDYRGLILTLIHKFDKLPKNINQRENIVIFIDEAHRSQEGELGIYMRSALPNAFYFGFTGTPIDKTNVGRGTFMMFGRNDLPKGYLDKYSILDSLEDKTTVQIHYTLAPNEIRAPTELLEKEFFKMIEEMGVVGVEELNKKILDKAVKLKNLLKSQDRVKKIAQFIAKHFRENVEPLGLKALVVGVDREACALIKRELDKYLPEEYSIPIYTRDYKDLEFMKEFYLDEREEKEIKKRFLKPEELPKILIVTSKLLTGFDAPILYVMYLDKPMSDHTLLQTIARVNRPFKGDKNVNPKTAGLIVDFIGIFEKLKKALRFDSTEIEGVLVDFKKIKEEFIKQMEKGRKYLEITGKSLDDKAVERIIDYFVDKEKRREFFDYFLSLQKNFELLSPDPFLRDYLDEYLIISGIFKIVKENFVGKRAKLKREIFNKTVELIKKYTETKGLVKTLPIYPINEKILKVIHQDSAPETVKIIKIHRSISILIDEEAKNEPFLFSLREKLEKILEEFEEKQINTKEALRNLEDLLKEINTARKEKEKLGLSSHQFGVYWVIKDLFPKKEKTRELAIKIDDLFNKYSNWKFNPTQSRRLKIDSLNLIFSLKVENRDLIRKKLSQILEMKKYV